MITSVFPPLGGAGVQRPLKFAKYLPEFGWMADVLTKRPWPGYPRDGTLMAEIPRETNVVRVAAPWLTMPLEVVRKLRLKSLYRFLMDFVSVPDRDFAWFVPAALAGLEMCAKTRYDVIHSLAPSYTCHLVGWFLHSRTGIPWVADFRDEWTEHPMLVAPTNMHRRIYRALERKVLTGASRVIATSDLMTEALYRLGGGDRRKYSTITNGYDEEDFVCQPALPLRPSVSRPPNTRPLKIFFGGSIYEESTIEPLIHVLDDLVRAGAIDDTQIVRAIAGPMWLDVRKMGPSNRLIRHLGYLSHADCLGQLAASDVLLITRQESKQCIPGKIFEYLRSGKPILAFVPREGAAARLVEDAHAGFVADSASDDEIMTAIQDVCVQWRNGDLRRGADTAFIRRYERKQLTGALSVVYAGALQAGKA
jgi:glycosyltransferase involved in cell wall biosynthesis